MWEGFPLFPEQASTVAPSVDTLYFFLTAVTVFFTGIIFLSIFYFAIHFRRRPDGPRVKQIEGSLGLEVFWSVVPLCLTIVMFVWGAGLFMRNSRVPDGALDIYVVGRQWMWKVQHTEGRREINELHVPVGQPIKLTLACQDVIHSFYIPAFRVKADVVPGRYTSMWFEATKAGEYHLFCAEYCGTQHSGMIGRVVAMEPKDFESWLGGGTGESPVEAGETLFTRFDCVNCHQTGARQRAPLLGGLFGRDVLLQDGSRVRFDEVYIRESIITPNAKVVAGYQPLMPTYRGQISEEQILQIIAYIRSLTPPEEQ